MSSVHAVTEVTQRGKVSVSVDVRYLHAAGVREAAKRSARSLAAHYEGVHPDAVTLGPELTVEPDPDRFSVNLYTFGYTATRHIYAQEGTTA